MPAEQKSVCNHAHTANVGQLAVLRLGVHNRRYLMPGLVQLKTMDKLVKARIAELKGVIVIDQVVPDYYAARPKACMHGWGRYFINITPEGKAMPCHATETIPVLKFDNGRETSPYIARRRHSY